MGIVDRENFIALLQRDDPTEIQKYLMRRGKRKKVNPIIEIEEIPPDVSIDTPEGKKKKTITAKADDIKAI